MPGFLSPLAPFFGLGSPAARAGFQTVAAPWLGAAAVAGAPAAGFETPAPWMGAAVVTFAPRHRLLLLGVR